MHLRSQNSFCRGYPGSGKRQRSLARFEGKDFLERLLGYLFRTQNQAASRSRYADLGGSFELTSADAQEAGLGALGLMDTTPLDIPSITASTGEKAVLTLG